MHSDSGTMSRLAFGVNIAWLLFQLYTQINTNLYEMMAGDGGEANIFPGHFLHHIDSDRS